MDISGELSTNSSLFQLRFELHYEYSTRSKFSNSLIFIYELDCNLLRAALADLILILSIILQTPALQTRQSVTKLAFSIDRIVPESHT